MERHTQRSCSSNQSAAARIDRTIGIQRTDHHAIAAQPRAGFDIPLHDVEFGIVVEKVTTTRPDQHVDRHAHAIAYHCKHTVGWRNAAFGEAAAQLNAVGTTFLRGQRRGQRAGGYFE